MKKILSIVLALSLIFVLAACSTTTTTTKATSAGTTATTIGEPVTLEFAQWFDPELPTGYFQSLMDQFEAANPGIKIKLLSNPYSVNRQNVQAEAATKTLPDVMGIDGSWVFDWFKQGNLYDLSKLMSDANYDDSQLADQIKLDGKCWMIPGVTFVYPLFVNNKLLKAANVSAPTNRSEFVAAAIAIAKTDPNIAGYGMALSLDNPGLVNAVIAWIWADTSHIIENGTPKIVGNEDLKDIFMKMKEVYDAGALPKNIFVMKEPDMVEEFTQGRIGMTADTLAHVVMIRKGNPDLDFSVIPMPVKDGYTGSTGMKYASWGLGIAANTKYPAQSWKFVQWIMSPDVNLGWAQKANALPGNKLSKPDLTSADPVFVKGFEIFQKSKLIDDFTGAPEAEAMQEQLTEIFQKYLQGDITIDKLMTDGQAALDAIYAKNK